MTDHSYTIVTDPPDVEQVSRAILETLPEWFGKPRALDGYVSATAQHPTWIAYAHCNQAVGFLTLKRHSPASAEIFVVGVRREERGRGCGRALLSIVEERLKRERVRWLTVKTLAADHPDPFYRETRGFYSSRGFEPLLVLEDFWGKDVSCLLMIKRLVPAP